MNAPRPAPTDASLVPAGARHKGHVYGVWAVALLLGLAAAYVAIRWRTEAHVVWLGPSPYAAKLWFGPSGTFTETRGTIVRTAPHAPQLSYEVLTRAQGYLEDGAVVEGGDLALVYYRHDGGSRARPFVMRASSDLQPRFTAALNGDRDRECATGYTARQLAGLHDTLWVSEVTEQRSDAEADAVRYIHQLKRFDLTGRQLEPVNACERCGISKLWAAKQHVVALLVRTSGEFPNAVDDYELAWFSAAGSRLGRLAIGTSALGPAELDATGSLVALTRAPLAVCNTTEPALVRIGQAGCTASVPLDALVLPQKPKPEPWTLSVGESDVYLFVRSGAERFERWLHQWSPQTDKLTIYRLHIGSDTFELLDHRVLESDYASSAAATWSDGRLLLLDGSPTDDLALRSLQYAR